MRFGRSLLTTALVGLAATLAPSSFAEPGAGESPAPAAAKGSGKSKGKAQPSGQGVTPPKAGGLRAGHHGHTSKAPSGASVMGEQDSKAAGRHGMGPAGLGGKRLSELEAKEKAGTLSEQEQAQLAKLRQQRAKHAERREQRQARLAELEQKEKAGSLDEQEKAELAKFKTIQARFDALDKKHAMLAKNRADRKRKSKKLALGAFPGIRKHPLARAEFGKHGERLAKLERAREVAIAKGNDELVKRIDVLLAKEQERHDRWLNKHQGGEKAQGAVQ